MMLTVLTHQLGQPPAAHTQDPEAAGHCPHPTELVVGQCSFISGAHVSWLCKSTKQANVTSCKIQHFAKKVFYTHIRPEAFSWSPLTVPAKKHNQKECAENHRVGCNVLGLWPSLPDLQGPSRGMWLVHHSQRLHQTAPCEALATPKGRNRPVAQQQWVPTKEWGWPGQSALPGLTPSNGTPPCRLLPVWALCLKKLREERFDVETAHSENKAVGVLGFVFFFLRVFNRWTNSDDKKGIRSQWSVRFCTLFPRKTAE